jgi:hypothetical protein
MPQIQTNSFSYGDFVWWMGVVEDVDDEEKVGRVKVRIYGYHNKDISEDLLYWAPVVQPANSASLGGIGHSPTGLIKGSSVIGFFADGRTGQSPVVFGSFPGKKHSASGEEEVFGDGGKYDDDEADTNRLARGETNDTNIEKKKEGKEEKVPIALTKETWDEKETEFAAEYPKNHVMETKSGHVVEFDDTDGVERISIWHKSGTFVEIHPKGETVIKVMKDRYEINEDNVFELTKGNKKETIDKEHRQLVKKDKKVEVKGDYIIKCDGIFQVTAKAIILN